jgi:hypothetical protein
MPSSLNATIKMVEVTGGAISVSLLVSGVIVTGTLTPWKRYALSLQEVLSRAMHEGGGEQPLPHVPTGPISASLRNQVRAEWDASLAAEGVEADDDAIEHEFPQFALRDAEIRSGVAAYWSKLPYLVVTTARVGAFAPVTGRRAWCPGRVVRPAHPERDRSRGRTVPVAWLPHA